MCVYNSVSCVMMQLPLSHRQVFLFLFPFFKVEDKTQCWSNKTVMFQRTVYLLSLNIVSEKTIYHKTRGTTIYMFSLTERYRRNINHLNILMKALISYYAISGFADNTNMRALTNMQLSYYHIHILPTLGQH